MWWFAAWGGLWWLLFAAFAFVELATISVTIQAMRGVPRKGATS